MIESINFIQLLKTRISLSVIHYMLNDDVLWLNCCVLLKTFFVKLQFRILFSQVSNLHHVVSHATSGYGNNGGLPITVSTSEHSNNPVRGFRGLFFSFYCFLII